MKLLLEKEKVLNVNNIYWLAGLFDGEASFYWSPRSRSCQVQLAMTDEDTIKKVCLLLNHPKYYLVKQQKKHYKQCYSIHFSGKEAVGIMMTLYSLLSKRRQETIEFIISEWKKVPNRYKVGMNKRNAALNTRQLTEKQRLAF